MDENSLAYSMDVLGEMAEALEPIGMTVEKQDPKETEGIPTGLIRPEGEGGWTITCNVVPTHKDNVSTTFVQLCIPITPPCPEQREELEKFARLGQVVFGVDGAEAAVDALAAFIRECGLPTKLSQLRSKTEITPELLRHVADSTNLLPNGPRQLTRDEVYEILMECR